MHGAFLLATLLTSYLADPLFRWLSGVDSLRFGSSGTFLPLVTSSQGEVVTGFIAKIGKLPYSGRKIELARRGTPDYSLCDHRHSRVVSTPYLSLLH